jgi:chorismate mutase/prephenate dehydratase
LHRKFPKVPILEVRSTAEAARRAAREEGSAAIASQLAAEYYEINILEEKIEDMANNITRFLVIGRQEPKATGDDKTSIMFGVKDKVGALYECLSYFDKDNISLTMIESRPSKNKEGEYLFFVDFKGHTDEEVTKHLIKNLKKSCIFVKILGSYPNGAIEK